MATFRFVRHKIHHTGLVEYRQEGTTVTVRFGRGAFLGNPPPDLIIDGENLAPINRDELKALEAKAAKAKAAAERKARTEARRKKKYPGKV